MAATKTESLVKNNVHACLQETALSWHTIELSDLEKLALQTATLEDGWIKALIKRFKPRISESIDKIQNASFSMIDIQAKNSIIEFTQTIFQYTKAAQIDSTFQQIIQV